MAPCSRGGSAIRDRTWNADYIERVESGLISYGADTDDAANPFELGLGRFMNDQGHDFAGKTALRGIRESGVTRRFMGLLIEGEPFRETNESPWQLGWDGGKFAGFALRAYSPRAKSDYFVAMVNIEPMKRALGAGAHPGPVLQPSVVELPIL